MIRGSGFGVRAFRSHCHLSPVDVRATTTARVTIGGRTLWRGTGGNAASAPHLNLDLCLPTEQLTSSSILGQGLDLFSERWLPPRTDRRDGSKGRKEIMVVEQDQVCAPPYTELGQHKGMRSEKADGGRDGPKRGRWVNDRQ